jgi:hypothetical protein
MDKITSHVIQINSNPLSLNSRVSDARASDLEVSDSKVSKASDTWVFGGLRHGSRRSRIQILGLGSETWS